MIEFECPQCGEGMSAPDSLAERTEECPSCGGMTRIPDGGPPLGLVQHREPVLPLTAAWKSRLAIGTVLLVALAGGVLIYMVKAAERELPEAIQADLEREVKRGVEAPPELRPTARPAPRPTAKPAPRRTGFTYRGRAVSAAWFADSYEAFGDKIALVNGRFHDVGKPRWTVKMIPHSGTPSTVGASCFFPGGHIRQALGKGDCLVELAGRPVRYALGSRPPYSPGIIVRLRGLDPARNLDGATFPDMMVVYVGKYVYHDTRGGRRTVPSYRKSRRLSRDEFARALASGFRLVQYTTRKIRKRVRKEGEWVAIGRGLFPKQVYKKARWVTVFENKLVAEPIP